MSIFSDNYDQPREEDEEDNDIDWEQEDDDSLVDNLLNSMQQNSTFQPSSPWTQPSQQQQYSPWGTSASGSWGNGVFQGATTVQTPRPVWGSAWSPTQQQPQPGLPVWATPGIAPAATNVQPGAPQIDRSKTGIVLKLNDVVIGSVDAQGRVGARPSGISDVYVRRDVMHKVRCFGATRAWIMIDETTRMSPWWETLEIFLVPAISEVLQLPRESVRFILDQGGEYLKSALSGIPTNSLVMVGADSGLPGQSGRDSDIAKVAGIDYVDVFRLVGQYV